MGDYRPYFLIFLFYIGNLFLKNGTLLLNGIGPLQE